MRGADGALRRRSGKCVHVGGLDGATIGEPERGTAPGSVLAALLGTVDLHDVLDRWCATEGQPRLQGKAPLSRYGEDCIIGVEREDEARRVVAVLDKRRERCGLTRHPDKTRRWPFRRPPPAPQQGKGPATVDFVGCTCYWARSRTGHWWRACQPRRARLRRAKTSIDDWCRRHRHGSIQAQHAARHRRRRGHCNSCGVRGHYNRRMRLVDATQRAWDQWLRRRRHCTRRHWERCTDMLRWWPLPRPRITVRMWDGEPRATSTAEPDGGNLLVRLWRGVG
jgi:RNA-directed DNA polymerase